MGKPGRPKDPAPDYEINETAKVAETRRQQAARAERERQLQLDRVEEMLAQGLTASMVCKVLGGPPPQGYEMSSMKVGLLIDAVYARWQKQRDDEAPYRREKLWKMSEVLYAKATSAKNLSVAATMINTMGKMLPTPTDAESEAARARVVEQLGPPPSDPAQLGQWAQRAMVLEMLAILGDARLEPERRVQFIALFGGKIGGLHPQAMAGRRLEELETQVATLAPRDASAFVDGETEEALAAFAERLRASIPEPPTEH